LRPSVTFKAEGQISSFPSFAWCKKLTSLKSFLITSHLARLVYPSAVRTIIRIFVFEAKLAAKERKEHKEKKSRFCVLCVLLWLSRVAAVQAALGSSVLSSETLAKEDPSVAKTWPAFFCGKVDSFFLQQDLTFAPAIAMLTTQFWLPR
jgi:hypothetical protein